MLMLCAILIGAEVFVGRSLIIAAVIANTFRYLRNFAWVEYLITTPWAEKAADQRWRLGGERFVRINHDSELDSGDVAPSKSGDT